MWPSLDSMLSWWQWLILAAVPPLIVLLYFLKLKRRPLEVPSTYLWHKSIEDLHVNTIWQRLRRNLLLLLQLLLILLAVLALLGLNWEQRKLIGNRFVFLVDSSASMQATDLSPSRLDEAKRMALGLIDQMKSGDSAMVVSFADSARVEQKFTDDRRQLREAVEGIQPTVRSTSLSEALQLASGLANPGLVGEDFQFSPDMLVHMFVLSDGKFGPVTDFALGNLEPVFLPIGLAEAANVGIVVFNLQRSEADPEVYQAFAQVQNFGAEDLDVELELHRWPPPSPQADTLIDVDELEIPAEQSRGVAFDLFGVETGVLELRLKSDTEDQFAVDNKAWAVVSPPRPIRVLLATPGNEPLELALTTESLSEIAEVVVEPPKYLEGKEYAERAIGGVYDLVIYDRCAPKEMPRANTLFIGSLPPREGWSANEKSQMPQLLPISSSHPLMQWIDLRDVLVVAGTPLAVPPGGSVLIDSIVGPMLVIAPREGFEDAVLGFSLLDDVFAADGTVERYIGTNWMTRQSFPVFVLNVFDYLGRGRELHRSGSVQPGKPVVLEGPTGVTRLQVDTPAGATVELRGDELGKFNFTDTAELGRYEVHCEGEGPRWFAVNLFSPAESNIRLGEDIEQRGIDIGHVRVVGQAGWETGRRDVWRWLLLAGLVVLLLEWYIYNRRVYL